MSGIQREPSAEPVGERVAQRVSRLPRRSSQNPTVKDLVKKYQDFLPAEGVQELVKSALPGVISESEPEYGPIYPRTTTRKARHHLPSKSSISDFEQGYAANVAPRYLTHSRRTMGHMTHGTRIPGPVNESSLESSRRPSPEKRYPNKRTNTDESIGHKYLPGSKSGVNTESKPGKPKYGNRTRPPPANSGKSNFRRPTGGGNKVSSIAKHFERINRDNERANRRYAVIRGRRARPVASARAKVEILDSIKDAINDESESSDSSEADDEGDGNDESRTSPDKPAPEPPEELCVQAPEIIVEVPPPTLTPPLNQMPSEVASPLEEISASQQQPPPGPVSSPPSPFLTSTKVSEISSQPPSEMELGPGAERVSILKAISGLWVQPQPPSRYRTDFDTEDTMSDPEHIFRDSSMVVRTDEPTSIIALALKYVFSLTTTTTFLAYIVSARRSTGTCCRNLVLRNVLHVNPS